MNNMYFTEEHELFRKSFQEFLQKEVVPHIEKWEETGTIESFIWEKFGDMGYFGLNYPEQYGGLDLDIFYTVIFLEELQKIKFRRICSSDVGPCLPCDDPCFKRRR
jgi:acyl-CoA dehydrogenase